MRGRNLSSFLSALCSLRLVGAALSGVSYGLLGVDPRWGLGLGLGTTVLGSIVFALRYRKTRTLMPAGLMFILSLGAAVLLGLSFGAA
ncbi:TMEM14 family protein [Thermostichus sp. MS-CIW-37]